MYDFFISHVQMDTAAFALDIYHLLSSDEYKRTVWLDIKMERQDEGAMQEGIRNCKTVLAIFSESFPSSAYCRKELQWAMDYGKVVIPIIPSTLQTHIGRLVQKMPVNLRGIGKIEFSPIDRSKHHRFVNSMKEILQRADNGSVAELVQTRGSTADVEKDGRSTQELVDKLESIANPKFLEQLVELTGVLTVCGKLPSNGAGLPDVNYPDFTASYSPEPGFIGFNSEYPGVQAIHKSPWVFVVNDFLNDDECGGVISKCYSGQLLRSRDATGQSDARECDAVTMPHHEVPSVMAKLAKLFGKPSTYFETMSLIKYESGGHFRPHYDISDPQASKEAGFNESASRVATIFVYCNDVPKGGYTHFVNLNLRVKPKKRQALVFFPMRGDGVFDERLLHEGEDAEDTKIILATWMYNAPSVYTPEAIRHQSLYPMSSDLLL